MKNGGSTATAVAIFVVVLVLVVSYGLWGDRLPPVQYWFTDPATFAECVEAGGAIMESYPEQCAFRGQTFVNPDQTVSDLTEPATGDIIYDIEIDTADWQTYRNEELGFGMKYPSNWPHPDVFDDYEDVPILSRISFNRDGEPFLLSLTFYSLNFPSIEKCKEIPEYNKYGVYHCLTGETLLLGSDSPIYVEEIKKIYPSGSAVEYGAIIRDRRLEIWPSPFDSINNIQADLINALSTFRFTP